MPATSYANRIPIGRKLMSIQLLLFAIIVAIGAFTFVVLKRVVSATDRVGARYAPQSERIADMQVLMFRISLEARHAMLVTTPEAQRETFERIGQFRKKLLATMEEFERGVSTDRGREFMAEWRKRDAEFWRLGGEVLAKVQAGDNAGAFRQLESDLVAARNSVLEIVDRQRAFQSELMLNAVRQAETDARRAELVVPALALLGLAVAGWMSWRLATMMRGAFRRAQTVTQRIANGDFSGEIYVRKGDEFGSLFESIVHMQERLNHVVKHVRDVAAEIAEAAREIDAANGELAEVTDHHENAVQGTLGVTQAMNASVTGSAESARRANELATHASKVAAEGGEMISKVVQTMSGIDESSRRIGDIVNVIDGIAFQTNILALNAAVEAARAGEQGRGFAVVASEVRALAQRSAQAAREVKTLIGASVDRVQAGSGTVDEAGRTLNGVVASVEQVTRLIDDLARGTREHTQGFAGIARAVDEIGSATQRSVKAVDRSGQASARLRQHAESLEKAVSAFNVGTS
jgi:methyl-accepting chemotaxis protein